jgi:RNA polymerase sigma-70 factor (ECF subfamily)
MSAAQHQDEHHDRLTQWVREHGQAVRGFLLAMVRRHDVADDLLQEVYRRAWQARGRYRESGAARAYLLRIADRLVLDHRRKGQGPVNVDAAAWEQIGPADCDADPSQRVDRDEAMQQLAGALNQLSEPQRRVLLLRYYGDMSFAEIADTLAIPLNTVLSHGHRGLKAMRKLLAEA